jgi:hypothetical protein
LAGNPTAKIVPGPGNYSGDYQKVVRNAPRFGIGTEKRKDLMDDKKTPGPGNYQINNSTDFGRTSVHTSMKGKHQSLDAS